MKFHINIRKVDRWLSVMAVLFAFVIIGLQVWEQVNVYAPLKHEPYEKLERTPSIYRINELRSDAIVSKSLFYNSDKLPITATVTAQWVLLEPRLTVADKDLYSVPKSDYVFNTSFEPGCSVGIFKNIVPLEVEESTKKLFAAGYDKAVWRLQGENKIFYPKLAPEPVEFYTENIVLIPADAELPPFTLEPTPVCESAK